MRRKKRMERKCSIRYRKKKKNNMSNGTTRDELRDTHFCQLRPKSRQKSGKKKLVKIRVNFARTLNSITVIIQLIFKAYQWVAYYLIIINVKN